MQKSVEHSWAQTATNTADIANIKENTSKLEGTFEKFMERMEEKLDDMNANMNKLFKEQNIKIEEIAKKQTKLESKLQGGWWVICALGAALLGVLSFFNQLHDLVVK